MNSVKKTISISRPSIGEDEWQALREPIMSGWLTQGSKVAEFEKAFAERHEVKHAIATSSCTTALHLILAALGITSGDEVIVPAFTWLATANAVMYCGAKPIFVDVDKTNYNIKTEEIASKISHRTKAIIPVHLFGLCADIDSIKKIAPYVHIIEDAACAAGSFYKSRAAGNLGIAGAFSFHPRKSITTGEGGMVTTNDNHLAEIIKSLRNHGATQPASQENRIHKPYFMPEFDLLGFNYRMTDLQAAIGLVQLRKLDSFIEERCQWAKFYEQKLSFLDWIQTPKFTKDYTHSWQSYVCYVDQTKSPISRNDLMKILQARGIASRPGTHAVHMLGYYKDKYQFRDADYPNAKDCYLDTLALPLHNCMEKQDYEYVVDVLMSIGKR
jgi:perosamine synthetase